MKMIEVNIDKISFDLMKEIPEEMRSDFSINWRRMNPEFTKNFLTSWEKLPLKRNIIELSKENYDEIIVKDLFGRDIFSFELNENLNIFISQYEGYWNVVYTESSGKLIIFTA